MPLKIIEVQARSLAAKAGIAAQDTIISINAMPVNDFFDLEYYSNDYQLNFELLDPAGTPKSLTVLRQSRKALGIEPEPYSHSLCANNCVFCFIDQLPPDLRPALYKKDDDYLYSYVFGNFITLNNLGPAALKRIIDQHISPLYISVHSTDQALRRQMMRHKNEFDLLRILRHLAENGISYHLQIVCVPNYNCGEQLRQTLADLLTDDLSALSIGIVPVGLTKYRDRLEQLDPYNESLAGETLEIIDEAREIKPIVQAADELFILAGRALPDTEYYGDFPQLENGIGMLRLTQMNWQKKRRAFLKDLEKSGSSYLFLTSRLASGTMEEVAAYLNARLSKARVRVQALRNDFFGERISVSGLLTATDILAQHTAAPDECVVLPSNVFNFEGLTLDDVSQTELRDRLGRPLLIVDPFFEDWDWI